MFDQNMHHLLARFAWSAVPEDSKEKKELFNLATRKIDPARTVEIVKDFPVVYSYLEMIADAHDTSVEDVAVHRAYIIGSGLLDKPVRTDELERYVTETTGRDASFDPMGTYHHNLHVNLVGRMDRPLSEEEKRDCRVFPGKLTETLTIRFQPMEGTDERNHVRGTNPFGLRLQPKLYLAVHQGVALTPLKGTDAILLKNYGFDKQHYTITR